MATLTRDSPEEAFNLSTPANVYSEAELMRLNHSDIQDSPQSPVVFYSVLGSIFLLGLIGNSLVILIIARHKSMRTAPNMYLLNLALADLLTTVTCATSPLLYTVGSTHPGVCVYFQAVMESSFGVCSFTLTALSSERYFAISRPFHKQPTSLRFTVSIMILTWISALSFVLAKIVFKSGRYSGCVQMFDPASFAKSYTLADFLIFYIIPLGIIANFYILMAKELYASNRSLPKGCVAKTNHLQARKRIALTVLILVLMFSMFYFPYNFMSLKLHFENEHVNSKAWAPLTNLLFCVGCLHNSFNPLVLYSLSKSFRGHFNNYLFYNAIKSPKPVEEDLTTCPCSKCSGDPGSLKRCTSIL